MTALIRLVLFTLALLSVASTTRADSANQTTAATPQIVEIGIYPVSIYDLNIGENTYRLDFYLWMKWKGDIDPTKTMEFTNLVDERLSLKEKIPINPQTLPDGTNYRFYRIEGRFVDAFDFSMYPFDRHELLIRIEDSAHTADQLQYRIDGKGIRLDKALKYVGWNIIGFDATVAANHYETEFGLNGYPTAYSSAAFNIRLERPISLFYLKLLAPLLIVFLAALAAYIIPPQQIESRSALAASALVTTVFLQLTYLNTLPDVGYLVLMDKIYLVTYFCILFTLVRVALVFVRTRLATETSVAQHHRTDKKVALALLTLFVAISLSLALYAQYYD